MLIAKAFHYITASRLRLCLTALVTLAVFSPSFVFIPLIIKQGGMIHLSNAYRQGSSDTDSIIGLTIGFYFEQTNYASKFDEDIFWSIKPGDTKQSVLTKLGQPRQAHGSIWHYASNRAEPTASIFFRRDVWFDATGCVEQLVGDLYFD